MRREVPGEGHPDCGIIKNAVGGQENSDRLRRFLLEQKEIDEQDIHQTIVIGAAAIVPHAAQTASLMDDILEKITLLKSRILQKNGQKAEIFFIKILIL